MARKKNRTTEIEQWRSTTPGLAMLIRTLWLTDSAVTPGSRNKKKKWECAGTAAQSAQFLPYTNTHIHNEHLIQTVNFTYFFLHLFSVIILLLQQLVLWADYMDIKLTMCESISIYYLLNRRKTFY